jgi:hypothetical protein
MSQQNLEVIRSFMASPNADPWVICDTRWYGKGKGSGMPIEQRVADAYEVKGAKIVRATMSYPDVSTALDALGVQG